MPISPVDVTTDPVQQGWNLLTAEFIRDVRGPGDSNYPTFRDGYLANEIMERLRGSTAQPLTGSPIHDP